MPPIYKNPYDFVPLEEGPLRKAVDERTQEAVKADLYTGLMVCTLKTETPLFIHGEGQQDRAERHFIKRASQPYVSASVLKGLIRSTYEIVTNSCVSVVPQTLKYDLFDGQINDPPRWRDRARNHKRTYETKGKTISDQDFAAQHPVLDLVPLLKTYEPCKDNSQLCPACALFGMVEHGTAGDDLALARAGRVYISDTDLTKSEVRIQPVDFPSVGGGPHPWHIPFYFEVNSQGQPHKLLGRKLYYHHRSYEETVRRALSTARGEPIKLQCIEGRFTFEVRFHNLRDDELHALVYAVELDDGRPDLKDSYGEELAYQLRHHFGFGKPLGLGSVAITIDSLRIVQTEGNGPARYLHYDPRPEVAWKVLHPPQGNDESPLSKWKKEVVEQWARRLPGGKESLMQFRRLLRWPSRESYEYPSFKWFRESPERSWPLRTYQAKAQNPSASTSSPGRVHIPTSAKVQSSSPSVMRELGRVKSFGEAQGFGSIQRADGSEIFVHRSQVHNRQNLREGQEVEFTVGAGRKGKTQAKDVKPL